MATGRGRDSRRAGRRGAGGPGSARDTGRNLRVARQVAQVVSRWLVETCDDPVARGAVVTHAEISADLSVARIFYLALAEDADRPALARALERVLPALRQAVARSIVLRRVPELRLSWDDVEDAARRVERAIATLETRPDTED